MSLILLHSPKGGTGSTTIAANLALGFARREVEVAALDLTGQDSLGLHLGVRPDSYGNANVRTDDNVVVIAGVQLLSVGRRRFDERDATAIVTRAAEGGSIVIVDLAAGDHATLAQLLPHAALRLCVLTPEPGTIALLPRIVADADDTTRFVVNRVDERLKLARDGLTFLHTVLDERLIGHVRRDEAINESLAMIEPLFAHMPASGACADFESLLAAVAALLVPAAERARSRAAA